MNGRFATTIPCVSPLCANRTHPSAHRRPLPQIALRPSPLRRPSHPLPQSPVCLRATAIEKKSLFSNKYDAEIAKIALPALGTVLLEPVMSLVDTAIIGTHLGPTQLAGGGTLDIEGSTK